jgi:hypothetical protein
VAPFALKTTNGESILFEAHILDIGGPKGTVVASEKNELGDVRQKSGCLCSNLYSSYRRYDRQHSIDTLNDRGWFGEKGTPPSWYTGEPWS